MPQRKRSGRRAGSDEAEAKSTAKPSERPAESESRPKTKRPRRRKRTIRSSSPEIIPFEWGEVEPERPAKPKRPRRAKRPAKADPEKVAEPAAESAHEPAKDEERGAKRKRPRRRKRAAKADVEPAAEPTAEAVSEERPEPAEVEPRPAKRKRPRRRKRAVKTEATPAAEPVEEPIAAPVVEERPEPTEVEDRPAKRKRPRRRKRAAKTEAVPTVEPAAELVAEPVVETPREPAEVEAKPAKRKRPTRRKKAAARPTAEPVVEEPREPAEAEPAKEEKPTLRKKPAAKRKPSKAAPAVSGFKDMPLSDAMFAALAEADYLDPTPIQGGLIPKALEGNDLMGQAQTGTGKTAAFAIPILEQLEHGVKKRGPQALILVPTRELAVQVRDECAKLAHGQKARVAAVYGGKPIRQQIEKLQRGVEVVVGTPGRVMDHMSRGTLFLGDLRQVVLDEADRMLDIGFRPDIEKILRGCPQSRQTLLLSATLPPPVLRLAKRYMRDPEELDFSAQDVAVETIEQYYFTVDARQKFDLLVKLIEREEPAQAIIFCRTRKGTERVKQRLEKKIKGAACIHGDLPQRTRDRVMEGFRSGKIRFMVATDVVGRGIDVSSISHIINFDIPEFCDDYVHRVGRTGRMGREGVAFSFVTPEEGPQLTRIEVRINRLLKRDEIAGFGAAPKPKATEEEAPEAKPVFGRRTRRVRRAL